VHSQSGYVLFLLGGDSMSQLTEFELDKFQEALEKLYGVPYTKEIETQINEFNRKRKKNKFKIPKDFLKKE